MKRSIFLIINTRQKYASLLLIDSDIIFSKNIFEKIKSSVKMLDEGLVKLFVLLYFI